MPSLPSFPCYHQRWLSDTAHLSLAAQGLYWRFLCWSWANGPIPKSESARRQLSGVGLKQFRPLWRDLQPYFRSSPKGFVNPRLEVIRREASEFQDRQKAKAKRRWSHAAASATAMPVDIPDPMPDGCLPISDLHSPEDPEDQDPGARAPVEISERQLRKVGHDVLDDLGDSLEDREAREEMKIVAAGRGLPYNGESIAEALDAVRHQRLRRATVSA